MSLLSNLQLVTKVYFPRTLLPLAAVIVPLVDLFVGLPVLLALMWYYDTWPGGIEVVLAPLFIGLAVVTALGSGFLLSAINVRFRDVRYMIPVFLQVLPLLSGVMFAVVQIPTKWQWILAVQPDDSGDQRLALGGARRARARLGSGRPGRRCCARPLRRRSRRLPLVRAAVRGHDLMATVIAGRGVSQALPPRRAPGRLRDAS